MGRTTPSTRMVLEKEIERILDIIDYIDYEDKDEIKDILKESYGFISSYQFYGIYDPLEVIVLGILLYLVKNLRHKEK
ncbi:MAG: hypothetical protein ACP5I6_05505 [Caldisphaera sp.]|jgi:hypothetical protein|nr:hypothetical protein [Caldisphaera sp.]PMP60271.1 MAG: hypothetical protein C0201_03155 [Caldisphaera sp.]PMP88676.1 MAG: hypothetical protein C0172_02070 [Caldisphaera sp.]